MAKTRTPIPEDIATEVLFQSDNTCCVCRERGKGIQIHHIDEDPSHHAFENLAVLCLECHNQTQISGGFSRKLDTSLVSKYRDEWLIRVKDRRDLADKLVVQKLTETESYTKFTSKTERTKKITTKILPLIPYLNSLPALREELLNRAQPEWDSGVTSRMVQASYDYIDALQAILITLAGYYPEGSFDDKHPAIYFSELISSRFRWHRNHLEPGGPGTGGTIINVMCTGSVIHDVELMIKDMVMSLAGFNDEFDYKNWAALWGKG